jgi:hypothetical protein
MPGNEDEAVGLLDAYLARASDTATRASLAPVVSGSGRIQSDSVGANLPWTLGSPVGTGHSADVPHLTRSLRLPFDR